MINPLRPLGRLLVTPIGLALRGWRAGEQRSITRRPELVQKGDAAVTLTSTSFRPDGPIPLRHAAKGVGDNVSPQLAWTRPPVATRAILLVMEDLDAPTKDPILHLAVVLDPTLRTVSEGELNRRKEAPGVRVIGGRAYQGPRALPGHGDHGYDFHLFALDAVPEGDTLSAVIESSAGHVIAHGVLTGTFRR
jgi:phosphatidylethanolamine-binding protein (PEBP) family uncharacterized protein